MSQPLNSPLSSIGHQDISPPASCSSLVHQYCYTSCRDGQRIIHDGIEEKVRFHRLNSSIKEEKGRTTLLARKRVVKSQLTMFLIPLWSDVLARAIQNTKYKIQYKNTDVLARAPRAIQAAVKPPDCGLIVQNNSSSHKMHPIIVN